MYKRKIVAFSFLSIVLVVLAVITIVWSSFVTAKQIQQINMANSLLSEHLKLSSTSYRLFKQLTDEILFGDQANQAKVRNKRALVSESLGKIKVLERQQRETAGEEYTQGTIEDTDDLEKIIDSIIYSLEGISKLPLSEIENEMKFILEEKIDVEFRDSINSAVVRQTNVVKAFNARIDAMNVTIFWVSIGLGFLAVVLMGVGVWVLVNSVTRPLSAISDAADAIGKGDFSYRVPRGFDREFDQIAVLFNVMTEKLQIQHLSEDQARLELEYKVSQRTTELMAVNAELAKSDSVRRSFLADISHELRTPLTIIRGEAQVALRHSDRDVRDYQDALTCIHEQAISLSHLVDDLLFVARTDSGTMRIDKRNVDLTALADEVIRDMRSLADKNDVSLEASYPVPVFAVIDPDRIKQLFIILVENALSYSGGGSSVKVSVLKQQGKAVVRVTDDGVGIDPRDIPFVFERFYRGGRSSSRSKGVGLGLAVAKSIIDAHEGKINLESDLGKGTSIEIELPCEESV